MVRQDAQGAKKKGNVQHPGHTTMKFCIDTFEIRQCDFLLQDHLIKRDDKVGVKETSVEDGQSYNPTDELEIIQMFGVDARVGVDLEGIVVVGGVFEKTIKGVKHFMR